MPINADFNFNKLMYDVYPSSLNGSLTTFLYSQYIEIFTAGDFHQISTPLTLVTILPSRVVRVDGCQFQCELTNVTPVVFIKLDEMEIYRLVC